MRLTIFYLFLCLTKVFSQDINPINGSKPSKTKYIALINANIVVSPSKTIDKGTILIENDEIIEIGTSQKLPKETFIIDLNGKTILPAFIETNSTLGLPKVEGRHSFFPQIESLKKGAYYWNESIHPEVKAVELYNFDEKGIDEYIKMGFGIVATRQNDGIAQGFSCIYSLGKENYNKHLVSSQSNAFFSFQKGYSNQTYPSSQMGAIALLRQALYDAKWYETSKKNENNLSLEALNSQIQSRIIFNSTDKYEILRAKKIADEFGLKFTYLGSGDEYEIIDELKKINSTIILPLTFPSAFDVKDPYVSKEIPLSMLKHWETAPANPFILKSNGIEIALSANGLNSSNFWKNIRIIEKNGLSQSQIIEALTIIPAKILGIENDFGTLEVGKKASFMVYDSNPFENDATLLESWILGEQQIHQSTQVNDIRGKYNMIVDEEYLTLIITGSKEKPSAVIKKGLSKSESIQKNKKTKNKNTNLQNVEKNDSLEIKSFIDFSGNDLTLQFSSEELKWKGNVSLHAKFNAKFGILEGDGILSDGKWVKWSAIRNEINTENKEQSKEKNKTSNEFSIWYPNMAFGFEEKPKQETILIINARIWTNENEGIIENGSILIENGKIKAVQSGNLNTKNARIIDVKGKNVTCGIIDEHSHIAISKGVNEGGQAISAEVSIADVVKADDIEIYRQLSGGVTAAQLLHGSANPIGGQSALIKLKWGHTPEEMLIPNAPKFIKFALGENVKQANWGEFNTIRFPQTRMGVEQIMYDAFQRAKAYEKEKKENPTTFRKDLELETLLEILNSERFITCHSYIQSEINMLMHLADSLNFKLNTFTHILEGYKVADKMKNHGAGASTFADWWAYKYEVNDAIPQNASLLNQIGIVTAINSDDAEMGRRLNQEAAKTIKYGGTSEIDAWKMVTLNPAKLLHLDQRMGSIKNGKDADIVIWSENPLSIEAKVETTIVDGEILFDISRDLDLRNKATKEKGRIITKMLENNENGGDKKPYIKKNPRHFHCNTFGEEGSDGTNEH